MFESISNTFSLKAVDVNEYSPLTLAYIGDSVYEIIVRTILVNRGNAPVNKLNKEASELAKAGTQAKIVEIILDSLSEEELAAYKRGRNAHPYTKAKNATSGDYHRATGFEALIGYLYLKREFDRITEIVKTGLDGLFEK